MEEVAVQLILLKVTSRVFVQSRLLASIVLLPLEVLWLAMTAWKIGKLL